MLPARSSRPSIAGLRSVPVAFPPFTWLVPGLKGPIASISPFCHRIPTALRFMCTGLALVSLLGSCSSAIVLSYLTFGIGTPKNSDKICMYDRMFYQVFCVQHSCSCTQSWGSAPPSIVETRKQDIESSPWSFQVGILSFFMHKGQKSYTPTAFGNFWTTRGVSCVKHSSSYSMCHVHQLMGIVITHYRNKGICNNTKYLTN